MVGGRRDIPAALYTGHISYVISGIRLLYSMDAAGGHTETDTNRQTDRQTARREAVR